MFLNRCCFPRRHCSKDPTCWRSTASTPATTSTDFLFDFELIEGQAATTDVGVPHAQIGNPTIQFGAIDVNPISGNQDEEFIELVNPNTTSVDISGWQLTGGVEHTFDVGTVILPGGSLYVSPRQVAFRARTTGPRGGQGLLVQGNYNGHLSNFGETVTLVATDGSAVASITTPSTPSLVQEHLRITEIHYHPANPPSGDGDLYEFIELYNTSPTETLDLEGVRFTGGIDFTFGDFSLPPGDYAVLASNAGAFAERYGSGIPIAGIYPNNLSNGGEPLRLDDVDGSTIHDFAYDDIGLGWHPSTDGEGYSLVVIDPSGHVDDWALGSSWRPSFAIGGSPGSADLLPGDFNSDGQVDLVDLGYLTTRLGTQSGASALTGDLTGDGAVNRADVARLVVSFGRSSTQPAASPVPDEDLTVLRARRRSAPRADAADRLFAGGFELPLVRLRVDAIRSR